MKIGISLNEVLRDFIGQLVYTYDKYISDIDIKEKDWRRIENQYFEQLTSKGKKK